MSVAYCQYFAGGTSSVQDGLPSKRTVSVSSRPTSLCGSGGTGGDAASDAAAVLLSSEAAGRGGLGFDLGKGADVSVTTPRASWAPPYVGVGPSPRGPSLSTHPARAVDATIIIAATPRNKTPCEPITLESLNKNESRHRVRQIPCPVRPRRFTRTIQHTLRSSDTPTVGTKSLCLIHGKTHERKVKIGHPTTISFPAREYSDILRPKCGESTRRQRRRPLRVGT